MPELPDITVYVEALERRVAGETLERVRIQAPFLLRTFDPPIDAVFGKKVREIRRVGKRIAIGLDDELWIVLHLMIAGRLAVEGRAVPSSAARWRWRPSISRKGAWCSPKPAASEGRRCTCCAEKALCGRRTPAGSSRSRRRSTSLKPCCGSRTTRSNDRSRTRDLFSGIGNAYSDEILHRARLSPLALSQKLTPGGCRAALRGHA